MREFGPFHVRITQIKSTKPFIEVAFKRFDTRVTGLISGFAVSDKFSVAAVADASFLCAIPQVAASRRRDGKRPFTGVRKLAGAVVAVIQRPHFFNEIRRVSGHAPLVAIRADLAVHIEIIQQHEIPGEPMQVGCDVFGEQAKLGIAVAFRHIAEDLVDRSGSL